MSKEINNQGKLVGGGYDDCHDHYLEFEQLIKLHFEESVANGAPLFTTKAPGLFEAYIKNLPTEAQQNYTCNACRHFIERYGCLVTISDEGKIRSAIWDEDNTPKFFKKSVTEMNAIVLKSKVNGIFVSSDRVLGQPRTGEWTHLAVSLPLSRVHNARLKTADQVMAEKLEDHRILITGLREYSIDVADVALNLLRTEALYRSDKVLGVAEWFKVLHDKCANTKTSRSRDNIIWLATATAPAGFCHIKSSMIGTLLDDIASGMSFEAVKRRFAEKMNPSNYMRSQSAPTAGGIAQAEKVVEKLGIANSLRRRYANFSEIPSFIWKAKVTDVADASIKSSGGVFGNLIPKGKEFNDRTMDLPMTVMTWEKFNRTVLPTADSVEAMVDNPGRLMAIVAAADETAENILLWNNTFSWYYHGGIDGEIKRRVESAGGKYENNEIRCSLIWEGLTDLDLHCITPSPNREHIYWHSKRATCGGYLDLDMNGVDRRSETPVENMRWASNAPQGHYKFYVHNYRERVNKFGTPFKAELEINGEVYHYCGGPLSNGDDVIVFEFDYVKGQQPIINAHSSSTSSASDWNINMNSFVKVNGITTSPNLWGKEPVVHSGSHIFFLLDGCKDLSEGKGRGFFNEMLKPELREIRKTLEAYTANAAIDDAEKASACGVGYSKDSEWNLILRVTSGNSTRLIKIDRWD
jgi:hypothetical protein